jgi:hypothetical protein
MRLTPCDASERSIEHSRPPSNSPVQDAVATAVANTAFGGGVPGAYDPKRARTSPPISAAGISSKRTAVSAALQKLGAKQCAADGQQDRQAMSDRGSRYWYRQWIWREPEELKATGDVIMAHAQRADHAACRDPRRPPIARNGRLSRSKTAALLPVAAPQRRRQDKMVLTAIRRYAGRRSRMSGVASAAVSWSSG